MRQTPYLVIMIVLLTGCLQELPFNTTLVEQNLVVDALIHNLNENLVVKLSRTLAYGVPPQPVSAAKITLYEDNVVKNLFLETVEGRYEIAAGDFESKLGAAYYLKIELNNGGTYQSDPEILLSPLKADSLDWKAGLKNEISRDGNIRKVIVGIISVHTDLANSSKDLFLKWDWRSDFQFTTMPDCTPFKTTTTCYFNNSRISKELKIYSNKDEGQQRLNGVEVGYESIEPEYQYYEIHYYSVVQQRISEKAYEYFKNLRNVSEQNGTIFDPIPAYVQGNIYNVKNKNERVLGYVLVAGSDIIRKKINAADVKAQYPLSSTKDLDLCGWLKGAVGAIYFGGCCYCYEFDEPVILKPDWW